MIVIGIGISELIMSYGKIDQKTCLHDAKLMMPGYKTRYECTRCHKFIVIETVPSINQVTKKGDNS